MSERRQLAQQLQADQVVPESGIYRVIHDPRHAGAQQEVTFIRGRRFPRCPHCKETSFELLASDRSNSRDRSARKAGQRRPKAPRAVAKFIGAVAGAGTTIMGWLIG
jgi:hypothetical protein